MLALGDFVRISYTAKLEDGKVIDTTDPEIAKKEGIFNENARYGDIYAVLGEGHILKGLEEDIIGKEVGYKGVVVVPPEKGFGNYDASKKDSFSITRFRERPQVGQRVRVGDKVGTVERIVGRRVIVDFNHPLAGKNITFEYEIKEKLEKVEDKLKALFVIHTGVDVKKVVLENDKAIVEVPTDAYLNQIFLIGRYRVIKDAFKHLNLKEIDIVERFEKGEVAKAVEEAKKEVAEQSSSPAENTQAKS
ncbi:MAG: peptidylprolyl isomerase [Archaeoglobi archaeon]|jgi:FKBP-type peptidyl-prolyl cis-trans isomerase SlyD|nr:MAG: peptidylprolyl isomerase [Archaeoglobi archaeon]TDA29072.1 MAG: peptidylprolyl isomerase [Archaeoglobi archaeon]